MFSKISFHFEVLFHIYRQTSKVWRRYPIPAGFLFLLTLPVFGSQDLLCINYSKDAAWKPSTNMKTILYLPQQSHWIIRAFHRSVLCVVFWVVKCRNVKHLMSFSPTCWAKSDQQIGLYGITFQLWSIVAIENKP